MKRIPDAIFLQLINNKFNKNSLVQKLTKFSQEQLLAPNPSTKLSIIQHIINSKKKELAIDLIKELFSTINFPVDFIDDKGMNYIHYATSASNVELIHFFFEFGVDVNLQDFSGSTPLFMAVDELDNSVVENLLMLGADTSIVDNNGESLIDICEEDPAYDEILELLQEYKYVNSSKLLIEAYSEKDVIKILNELSDSESPQAPFLNKMVATGGQRTLQTIDENIIEKIDNLIHKFPNFVNVIDYLKEQIALSLLSKEPFFHTSPILMVGGHGIGKTRFSIELSNLINTDIVVIDGGNISGGFVIGGSNAIWKESSPGKVCKQIVSGEYANPIIQIDEIDKMTSQSGFDPYGPLHPLLEPKTAKTFTDEFIGVPIDCGYVNWFATANYLTSIPDQILSRFTVLNVPDPSKDQMKVIVESVYDDILKEHSSSWGNAFAKKLDNNIVESMLSMTPREINRVLLSAMGKVALASYKSFSKDDDTELSLSAENVSFARIGKKNRIGV